MYTEQERETLFRKITEYLQAEPEFVGCLQIGSGVAGYRDIYSDIDLMAGCMDCEGVKDANEKLLGFFSEMGAIYVDRRRWSDRVLGLSAYFKNGMSMDISFMPVEDIGIRSEEWKLLFSKSSRFADQVRKSAGELGREPECFGIDDRIHHKFMYALRKSAIAVFRGEYIYADMALSEARQYLLLVEAVREGKKMHQFKAFQSLEEPFRVALEETYPSDRNRQDMLQCVKKMVELYQATVSECGFLRLDGVQKRLLDCFLEEKEF